MDALQKAIETAQVFTQVKADYRKAVTALAYNVEPMGDDEFYDALAVLADGAVRDRKRGVKSAIHNFFCATVWQSYGRCPSAFNGLSGLEAWQLMARFLKRYEQLKSQLSKKCNDLPGLERGDDGYGDLMDSLPLAGRFVVTGLLEDDIANFKQLEKAISDHPLKDFILDGENYITMTLEDKLRDAFAMASHKDQS